MGMSSFPGNLGNAFQINSRADVMCKSLEGLFPYAVQVLERVVVGKATNSMSFQPLLSRNVGRYGLGQAEGFCEDILSSQSRCGS